MLDRGGWRRWAIPSLIVALAVIVGCTGAMEQIDDLIDVIAWTGYDSDTWNQAVDELTGMDRTAARQLVAVMAAAWYKGENFREYTEEINAIRAAAGRVLGRLKYRPGAATVIAYVTTAYPEEVRVECAWAFGEIQNQPVFDANRAKFTVLLSDSSYAVQLAGAVALCKLDDEEGTEHLIDLLGSEDEALSEAASDGLKEADYHAVAALTDLLETGDPGLRSKIAPILAAIRESLLGEVEGKKREVRRAAARALGDIQDRRDVELLARRLEQDDDSLVRFEAAIALSKMNEERGRTYLFDALGSDDNITRTGAIRALVEAGSSVEDQLLASLSHESPLVRAGAIEALGLGRVARAAPELIQALGDKTAAVRRSAAIALANIGSAEALEQLIRLEQDEDATVAYYANWALEKLKERGKGAQL